MAYSNTPRKGPFYIFLVIFTLLFTSVFYTKCFGQDSTSQPQGYCEPIHINAQYGWTLYRIELIRDGVETGQMEILKWDNNAGWFPTNNSAITCTMDIATGTYFYDESPDSFVVVVRSKGWVKPSQRVVKEKPLHK